MLLQLVTFNGVRTMVKLVKELEEFGVSVFGVCRAWKHVDHVFGDVGDIRASLLLLFLCLDDFLGLLGELGVGLVHGSLAHHWSTHHCGVHPRLLEALLVSNRRILHFCGLGSTGLGIPDRVEIQGLVGGLDVSEVARGLLLLLHCVDLHRLELLG